MIDDHSLKTDQDGQQVEPGFLYVAQNETVSTSASVSPPPTRTVPSSSRPSTLQLGTGQRSFPSILLTPGDYSKLRLSTPELDDKARTYTIISSTTPTVQLQTPDVINGIPNVQTLGNMSFNGDTLPSPGVKQLEELLSVQQQPMQADNTSRQYIVLAPEAHQLFQQMSNGANTEQFAQFTQAFQKVLTTPTGPGGEIQCQTPLQETLLALLTSQIPATTTNQDLMTRQRSVSSSLDAPMNGNDSSNSTLSSTSASPLTNNLAHATIMLQKVKDEPQHVPTLRNNNNNSQGNHINLEQNELIKKEKKRERNRQAAQKCRTRKLTRIAELQKRVNELQERNKELSDTADRLKTDISRLERQLQEHQNLGCTTISNGTIQ